MKRVLSIVFLLLVSLAGVLTFAPQGDAYQQGAIRIREVDGSPNGNLIRTLIVANSSLSVSGDTATWTGVGASLAGAEGADGLLTLAADESDDSGDDWQIESDATSNDLIFSNDASGSQATKLTIADTDGALTLTGAIVGQNGDSILMNTDDFFVFSSDDENTGVNILGFEAKTAILLLSADQSDDNGDDWQVVNTTGNQLQFNNDTSGSQVLKFGATAAGAFVVNGSFNFAADAAGSDTYAITLAPAPTAYTTGMVIVFTAGAANTGACTVNVNGLGAKALFSLNDGSTPADNYIETGSVVVAVYDGTQFQMIQPDANP